MKVLSLFFLLFSGALFAESDLYDRAKAYYYGDGVEQNYSKAFKAFSHANKAGDLAAKTALGLMYIEGKGTDQNDKKGIDLLKESANRSHAQAQYYLGSMYYLGIGVTRNSKIAHQWIKKAAFQFNQN